MKIQPLTRLTADNIVSQYSTFDDFSIQVIQKLLALYRDEQYLGSFDEISVYPENHVFVCRDKVVYTVVNEKGESCSDFSAVGEYLFLDEDHLYVDVKKHVAKADLFNVLDIGSMSFLYNVEHRHSLLTRFKKRAEKLNWPFWLRLFDVDNGIMIIERAVDSFSFNRVPVLNIAPIINYVDNFQRMPNGDYIVHETRYGMYKIVEASGKLSVEHCSGFKTLEELVALEKEYYGENYDKMSPLRDAQIQGVKIDLPNIERPLSSVEQEENSEDSAFEEVNAEEMQREEQPVDLGISVVECAKCMLEFASRDRVESALQLLFYDRVMELRGVDEKVDECLDELVAENDALFHVDDAFFETIRSGLDTEQLKEDFDLCRSYLSRKISDPKELFTLLCEDEMIGDLVKGVAENVIAAYREKIKPSDEQIRRCLSSLVGGIQFVEKESNVTMMQKMEQSVKDYIFDNDLKCNLNTVIPLDRFPLYKSDIIVVNNICMMFRKMDDILDAVEAGSTVCKQTYNLSFPHDFDRVQELLEEEKIPVYWLLLKVNEQNEKVTFYDWMRPLTYVVETKSVYMLSLKRFV